MSNHNRNHNQNQNQHNLPKATPPAPPAAVSAATESLEGTDPSALDVTPGADPLLLDAPPPATVSVDAVKEERRAAALQVRAASVGLSKDKMTVITPRETIPRMRYGKNYYAFEKGKAVSVSVEIARHMQERDLC